MPWQIVGYQERCDVPDPGSDEETTFWREYLLFNKAKASSSSSMRRMAGASYAR